MGPHTLLLLRRVAVYSLVAALALVAVPAVLTEFGLLGPSTDEIVDDAARAVEAARMYGASGELPAFQAANRELESARRLAREGSARAARHAAARASNQAVEAQRLALVRREEDRRLATSIVTEVDRQLTELEDLYSEVTPGLEKGTVSQLLSRMKDAREAGGGLFLAFEQGNFGKVVRDKQAAQGVLASTKAALLDARTGRGGS